MNQRTLDRLIPTLDPELSPPHAAALREIALLMDDAGYFIAGHDHASGVLHMTFANEERRLTYSIGELAEHAERVRLGAAFPWAEEFRKQGG